MNDSRIIAVLATNFGPYHIARLTAAHKLCKKLGWNLVGIQITDDTLSHSWGDFTNQVNFDLITLFSRESKSCNSKINLSANQRLKNYLHHANQTLKNCLHKLQPDILFLPGWSFSIAQAGLNWCKRNGTIPIVMSESKEDDFPRNWLTEFFKSLIVKRYKAALVGGKPQGRYLVKLGMPAEAIFYGYDVVGNDDFHPDKIRHLPKPIAKSYFLAINRFAAKKNLPFLLDAYAAYRQATNQEAWDIVICGDGELRPQLEQQIARLGIQDCVHLPGFLQQEQLLPYFAHANCFIHASIQEQWGLVVNEAMAAGLPVLVSNRCGCFEDLIIEGVNGFSFDPTNQQQLTDFMLNVSSGEVNLEKMGKAALEHIQKFSPDYFAQGLMQAVEYALAQKM